MSAVATLPAPPFIGLPMGSRVSSFRRFTVAEYHKLIDIGILTEDDNLELLDGHLVNKMSRNAPHDGTIDLFRETVGRHVPGAAALAPAARFVASASSPRAWTAAARASRRSLRPSATARASQASRKVPWGPCRPAGGGR